MGKIDTWVANQLPDIRSQLEVIRGVDFLHISTDHKIKKMRPRIGDRQMKAEDRTIPRICGSESLVGCILGHGGFRTYYVDKLSNATQTQWANGYFTIYKAKVDQYVRPSWRLVPDSELTKELWIVPYAPECYEIEVEAIGQLYLRGTAESFVDGVRSIINTVHLNLNQEAILDNQELASGYYSFTLEGELFLTGASRAKDVPKAKNVVAIKRSEWTDSLQKLKKVFGDINTSS